MDFVKQRRHHLLVQVDLVSLGAVRSSEVRNGALATKDLSAATRRALRGNTGATGPVPTWNGGPGITDFSVPGVTFQSVQDVAVCTAGEEDIIVDVESVGGNTLRVLTSNLAATNSQLYCTKR